MTRKRRRSKQPACPSCESGDVIPIVYGMPGLELRDQADAGKVALGGCCISENDPEWHCKQCSHEWREGA